jgi:hypothetical protein
VASHPDDASQFGGVVTTTRLSLPLPKRGALLARADGRLIDNLGHVLIDRQPGLQWHRLDARATSVRCEGRCDVVLAGDVPPGLPSHAFAPDSVRTALHLDMGRAWLGSAKLAAHAPGILRLNMRYDSGWAAFIDGKAQPHFQLDTAINAWQIDASTTLQKVLFVHVTSLVQCILEIAAFAVLCACLISLRGRPKPQRLSDERLR